MSQVAGPTRFVTLSFLVAAATLSSSGCVRRTVTINTKPEGATVALNEEVVGTTPVTTDFLWYGDYDVLVRKEGYETLRTNRHLNAPWYQLPVIDFFAETLLPIPFHDRQQMEFELSPAKEISREQLIQNAKECRDEALYGTD